MSQFIFDELAALIIQMSRHTHPTTCSKWASTKRQLLLDVYRG